jgi:hypothetical protein
MRHEYDLFERFSDGSSVWRACAIGLDNTRRQLLHLTEFSPNRFYAMHVASGKIVSLDPGHAQLLSTPATLKRGGVAAA